VEEAKVVDIDPMIQRTVLCRVQRFWGPDPLCQGIRRIEFFENPADAQISKLEVNRAWIIRTHFISRECGENVIQVNVLVGVLVQVQILNCLKNTSSNRKHPNQSIEILQPKEV